MTKIVALHIFRLEVVIDIRNSLDYLRQNSFLPVLIGY